MGSEMCIRDRGCTAVALRGILHTCLIVNKPVHMYINIFFYILLLSDKTIIRKGMLNAIFFAYFHVKLVTICNKYETNNHVFDAMPRAIKFLLMNILFFNFPLGGWALTISCQ